MIEKFQGFINKQSHNKDRDKTSRPVGLFDYDRLTPEQKLWMQKHAGELVNMQFGIREDGSKYLIVPSQED